MAEPKPPSDQSSSYALTTISSHVSSDRRAVTDMNGERRGRCVAHHFNAVCGDGVVYAVGPVRPPHSAPNTNYHLLGCRSTVQTSAHERRKGTLRVRWRSDILAHLCPRLHWLWVTVEPHITGTRHEEAVARKGGRYAPVRRVLGSEPLSLRTHRHRGRSRPLRSAVVEYQAPSVAV